MARRDNTRWFTAIRAISKDRDKLLAYSEDEHGKRLTFSSAETFAYDGANLLGSGWIGTKQAIRDTVARYVGEVLGRRQWRQLCWQIAANRERLLRGLPLTPFEPTLDENEVPMDIIGLRSDTSGIPIGAVEFEFRALSGVSAGFSMRQIMYEAGLIRFAHRLGFGRRKIDQAFDGVALRLFGLYFLGYLREAQVQRYAVTGEFWQFNRKVIRMRSRDTLDVFGQPKKNVGCPRGLTNQCWECHLKREHCPAGY